MHKNPPKILVIVGPTASGKTGLAISLAKKLRGEIVSADSRLLYKGMDIGTAKPTRDSVSSRPRVVARGKLQSGPFVSGGISHHLIDVVTSARTLTLAEYKAKALKAIRGILKRGRLPIIVGGTGLYVRALVDNLQIPEVPPDPAFRARWEKFSAEKISHHLKKKDPAYAARIGGNPRYAIRALEVMRATGKTMTELQKTGEPLFEAFQIGLRPPKARLEARVSKRVRAMVRAGLVEEVRRLRKRYGEHSTAMSGIGYRELLPYLKGEIGLEAALESVRAHTRQYARRQMTWFKRDALIHWISGKNKALPMVKNWLKQAK